MKIKQHDQRESDLPIELAKAASRPPAVEDDDGDDDAVSIAESIAEEAAEELEE